MHNFDDLNCPFREVILEAMKVVKETKKKLSEVTEQLNYLENKLSHIESDVCDNRTLTDKSSFKAVEAQNWSEVDKSLYSDLLPRVSEREDDMNEGNVAEVVRNIKSEPLEPSELDSWQSSGAACSRESSSAKRSAVDYHTQEAPRGKCCKNDTCAQPGSSSRTGEIFGEKTVKTEALEYSPGQELLAGNENGRSEEKTDQCLSLLSGVFCPRAVTALKLFGFVDPALQAQIILPMLKGRNMVVSHSNGVGKTVAFLIAVVEILCCMKSSSAKGTRVLILSPTNEQAFQTCEVLKKLLYSHRDITYGMLLRLRRKQHYNLEKLVLLQGFHILVSASNRLFRHIQMMNTHFRKVQCIVVDNMDLSVINNLDKLKRIITMLPSFRQVAAFAADEMPNFRIVDERIGRNLLHVTLDNGGTSQTAENVEHYYVYCEAWKRTLMIFKFLIKWHSSEKVIVFFTSQTSIVYFHFWLKKLGVPVHTLKKISLTEEVVAENVDFLSSAETGVLLCTQRQINGLDVGVSLVIHYDCPPVKDYIYRAKYAAHGVGGNGKSLILLYLSENKYLQTLQENGISVQEYNFAGDGTNIKEFHSELHQVVSRNQPTRHAGEMVCVHAIEHECFLTSSQRLAVAKTFGLEKVPKMWKFHKAQTKSSSKSAGN